MRPPVLRLYPDELIVDSFAGAGGASSGIEIATGRSPDVAINHNAEALAVHAANHPATRHFCEDVWKVDPVTATQGRPVGLMWLSPDCRHFSKAKGGKPVEKKVRGLAWLAPHWAKAVRPRVICLENVTEFLDWGPLTEDDMPCPLRKGLTFRRFVKQLQNLGYSVDWQELKACDYGAPTTRKRLFLVARCDGEQICWPEPTHGRGRLPYRTAAQCIDWSIPCPSIFERSKPLADATLRRIAAGIRRYVVEAAEPFVVAIDNGSAGGSVWPTSEPLSTIVTENRHALVTAFLAKHYGGVVGSDLREPIGTVTAVDHHSLVTAFLIRYYTQGGNVSSMTEPLSTITTHDRVGLVTVRGERYRIVDIGLRMLQPHELQRAQGFSDDYRIEGVEVPGGRAISKSAAVRLIGNSVCPPVAAAVVRAQLTQEEGVQWLRA